MTFVSARLDGGGEEARIHGKRYDIVDHKNARYLVGEGPDVLRVVREYFHSNTCNPMATAVPITNQRRLEEVMETYGRIAQDIEPIELPLSRLDIASLVG